MCKESAQDAQPDFLPVRTESPQAGWRLSRDLWSEWRKRCKQIVCGLYTLWSHCPICSKNFAWMAATALFASSFLMSTEILISLVEII